MYSSESCRAQMAECKNLLSSAESRLTYLTSWSAIGGCQTERYTELVRNRPPKSKLPQLAASFILSPIGL